MSDAEWEFCGPYLLLMKEEAPQRTYPLREIFNALRYMVRCGCQWRMMPNDLPPWAIVYQQAQRWMKAGASKPWPTICASFHVLPKTGSLGPLQ